MSEATLADPTDPTESTPADAALDQAEGLLAEHDGPSCDKCGLATDAAACPRCGWYPSLGIHVEIDEAFEAVMTGGAAAAEEAQGEAPAEAKPEWRKHLEVWNGLIPGWAWMMIATTLGAVGAGIGIRVATLTNPTLQTYCGIGGLALGLSVAAIAHLVGFLLCSSEDADFGVPDLLIKPLKTWKKLAANLPERVWLANSANLGVSVALASALIVGGIPYEKLLDWGYKPRAKKSLVAAIAEQAANAPGNGTDNLEDAIGDFAGKGAAAVDGATPKPVAPKPRKKLETLIIGYQTNSQGKLIGLLLAADQTGKLKYVGRVRPQLTKKEEINLLLGFEKHRSTRPFVKTPEAGSWVRPKFMCRVTYAEWPNGKRPKDLEWDAMMDDVQLGW